jgi:hypothetical protein
MYISWPYIIELGLKPDLVYNLSVVASTAFRLPFSLSLAFTFIILTIILTLRIRVRLYQPLAVTISLTLEY